MQLLDYNNILLCSSLFFISMSTSLLVLLPVMYFMKPKTETKVLAEESQESEDEQSEAEKSEDEQSEEEAEQGGSEDEDEEGEEDEEGQDEEGEDNESEGHEEEQEKEDDEIDILLFISDEFNKIGGLKLYVSVEDLSSDQCIRIVDKHSVDDIFKYILEKRKIQSQV